MQERLLDLVEYSLKAGLPWKSQKHSSGMYETVQNDLSLSFGRDFAGLGYYYSLYLRDKVTHNPVLSLSIGADSPLIEAAAELYLRTQLVCYPPVPHLAKLLLTKGCEPVEFDEPATPEVLWAAARLLNESQVNWESSNGETFRISDLDRLACSLHFHKRTPTPDEEISDQDLRTLIDLRLRVSYVEVFVSTVYEGDPAWGDSLAIYQAVVSRWESNTAARLRSFYAGPEENPTDPGVSPEQKAKPGFWNHFGFE